MSFNDYKYKYDHSLFRSFPYLSWFHLWSSPEKTKMNSETPKNQTSSSAPHDDDPKQQSPESTLQGGSDMGMPLQRPESESVEAKEDELGVATSSASASASAISYGEEDTLSSSSLFHHSQINSTSPTTRDSFSSNKPSPSSPTKHSHDPNARNTNSQNLHSAEAERFEHVMQTIDKQELGKHILGLAIPMAMGLVFSNNPLAMTKNMQGVAISLSFAFAATWNGLLLRKTYRKASTLILILGIAMMLLAFYAFLGSFLPLHLTWIPALCWLASVIPFAIFGWAYFQRKEVKDPEKGETDGPKL